MSANATSDEPQTVVSGVTEDKYEYKWRIENILMVHKDGFPVETQKFEFEAGRNSSMESKWEVGLHGSSRTHFYVYCKLLKIYSSNVSTHLGPPCDGSGPRQLTIQFVVQLLKSDGSIKWTSEKVGIIHVDGKLNMDGRHWWTSRTSWKGIMDSTGAVTFAIKLSILHPASGETTEVLGRLFQAKTCGTPKRNLELIFDADSMEYDFKIVCKDGKELKCHRAILKGNCEVFKTMLESGLSEAQTGVVHVSDISGKVMEVLLKYLYTGELLPSWSEPDVVEELLYAAGKYQLTELLDYLDNMIGRKEKDRDGEEEEDPNLLVHLLDMSRKMSLKKAEARLKERIIQFTVSAVSDSGTLPVFQFGN